MQWACCGFLIFISCFFFCFFSFHFWGAQSAEAARRRANDQLQANKLNIRNPNATAPACQYAGLLLFERTFPKRHLNAPARTCSTSIPIPIPIPIQSQSHSRSDRRLSSGPPSGFCRFGLGLGLGMGGTICRTRTFSATMYVHMYD